MPPTNSNLCTRSACCKGLSSGWKQIVDIQPHDPPTDPECLLWYERVKCSRFDLLVPFLQAFFVLLDAGLDMNISVKHYQHGRHYWALYTVIIVAVTQIFLQAVSAFWFIEDERDENKQVALKENGIQVKPWVLIGHLLIFGRFVRFYQMWKVLRIIRSQGRRPLDDIRARHEFVRRYTLYISQTGDCNTLQLMEAYLEQAPQVVLQLYILMYPSQMDLASRNDRLLMTLNIVKSLLLFAFVHLTYARDMRRQERDSAQLKWFSKGAVSLYFWRLLMLVSRILVLALFASSFKGVYTSILITLHFLVFLVIVAKQDCDYLTGSPKKQNLFKLAVAYIHIFSFFPLVSEKTGKWGYIYYGITFLENSFILMLCMCHSNWDSTFKIAVVVVEKTSFGLGLVCLVLYYHCFHPSFAYVFRQETRV